MCTVPRPPPAAKEEGRAAVRQLVLGGAAAACGTALGLLEQPDASAALTLAGLAVMLWNLHRLGRAGPI